MSNIGIIRDFVSWYNNEFKQTYLYKDMQNISENSPYHRENDVAAHTDMVVMNLLGYQTLDTNREHERMLTLFAAAFHDVGKPSMRLEKHNEERGVYHSYAGHELRSARLWQDFYISNREMFVERFNIEWDDFYVIAVMIEKHRPWGIKDMTKIDAIFSSLKPALAVEFLKLLIADNTGRISDSPESLEQSLTHVGELADRLDNHNVRQYQVMQKSINNRIKLKQQGKLKGAIPQLIIPISQAGSGKSSLFKRICNNDKMLNPTGATFYQHSMDIIRAQRYGDDTELAFRLSNADKEFRQAVQADFIDAIKRGDSIFVDNTNLSAKRRRFYITEARRHGYDTHAFIIPLSLFEAVRRNNARTDKRIGTEVVIQQYLAMSMPLIGADFDSLLIVD